VKGKEAKEIQPEILELYIIFVCLIWKNYKLLVNLK
jgi:hypothetical protein